MFATMILCFDGLNQFFAFIEAQTHSQDRDREWNRKKIYGAEKYEETHSMWFRKFFFFVSAWLIFSAVSFLFMLFIYVRHVYMKVNRTEHPPIVLLPPSPIATKCWCQFITETNSLLYVDIDMTFFLFFSSQIKAYILYIRPSILCGKKR